MLNCNRDESELPPLNFISQNYVLESRIKIDGSLPVMATTLSDMRLPPQFLSRYGLRNKFSVQIDLHKKLVIPCSIRYPYVENIGTHFAFRSRFLFIHIHYNSSLSAGVLLLQYYQFERDGKYYIKLLLIHRLVM